jgi:hypothetical protein
MDSKIWIGIVVVLLLAVVAQAISVNATAVQKCNSVKLNNITLFQCGKNVLIIDIKMQHNKMFAICRNGTVLVIGGVTNIREAFEKMEQIFDICSTYAQKSIKVSTKRVLRITST